MWTDITESRAEAAELRRQATTDSLTGLDNRVTLFRKLDAALASAGDERSVAVLYVDLDHFKPVNDGWGHEAGDELLAIVAERLQGCVRQGDVVGRIGGDEFVIVVHADRGDSGPELLGQRVVEVLGQPFDLSFATVTIGASVGLAFGGPGDATRSVIHRADMAAYEAKSTGRARLVISTA
jgi:diguanylate cyclase (GGDEF)-like protein